MAIGEQAGSDFQSPFAVAIGPNAASIYQGIDAISIGRSAGRSTQGQGAIAIGKYSGANSQGQYAISMGYYSGQTNQGTYAIAMGINAGANSQGQGAVAIGVNAGSNNQGNFAVAIGVNAGQTNQGTGAVAISFNAGFIAQGENAVAIGQYAGQYAQGYYSVAMGYYAGQTGQGYAAVAMGQYAGYNNQGTNAIAIGQNAGYFSQGQYSIAIGASAGCTYSNSILLNASGNTLNAGTTGACYINPIRSVTGSTAGALGYDTTTNEVIYYTGKTFVIDHPVKQDSYLVHACLEGPESGVYYRGQGKITNNKNTTIYLPDYVSEIANDFTIQVTAIVNDESNDDISNYKNLIYVTSKIRNNSFQVYGTNGEFYWLVQGKRQQIHVEPLKSEVQLNGDGPYKWISSDK